MMLIKHCTFLILLTITYSQSSTLTCNKENKFKIIQLTDTHFGETITNDQNSVTSFTDLIGYESPDLITLTGDFVSGYAYNGTKGWFKDTFDYAITPILSSNIAWSYILGNHDDQADWNRTQIISYAASLSNSKTYLGPSNISGASNYVLTIMGGDNDNEPIFNIWFLDSLDTNCYDVKGWGCVELSTVQWYQQQSIALEQKYGKVIPGIMYIHIPIPELLNLYNNYRTTGTLEDSGICCWSLNTGLFSVMKSRGDILGVWHGHDHDNDFHGSYHGIQIGYGRKTGFGGYGPPTNLPRGSRVYEIDCNQGNNYTTWVRENDGTKVTTQTEQSAGDWRKWKECCDSDGAINRNLPIGNKY